MKRKVREVKGEVMPSERFMRHYYGASGYVKREERMSDRPSAAAMEAAKGFSLNKMGGRSRYKEYDEWELARLLDAYAAERVRGRIAELFDKAEPSYTRGGGGVEPFNLYSKDSIMRQLEREQGGKA